MIAFVNLKRLYSQYQAVFDRALLETAAAAYYVGGEPLTRFEQSFSAWVGGSGHCVGCANGSDAIVLAVKALEIPAGSKAIVPAMTYPATAFALENAGLEIIPVDVTAGTWLLDLEATQRQNDPSIRVVVPVHLYGQMVAMDHVAAIAREKNWWVIEDAAQAHGSKWQGQPVGTHSDIATFSFYPGKNLGALGDAGAVLTADAALAQRVRALGNQGGLRKYEHDFVGYNSRLDTLQAAILTEKLFHLREWNTRRQAIAAYYLEKLSGVANLQLPIIQSEAESTWHLFVVTTPQRDALKQFLAERRIETAIHYPRALHQIPAYAGRSFAQGRFPSAERVAAEALSLPIDPMMTDAEVETVATSVAQFFRPEIYRESRAKA